MLETLLGPNSEKCENFFDCIEKNFPAIGPCHTSIEQAYDVAKSVFCEIKCEDEKRRSFEHLHAVMLTLIVCLCVKDYRIIAAALLCNVVEYCPAWTIRRVRDEFDDEVALLVEWLTEPSKDESLSKTDRTRLYHKRLRFLIKLSERFHKYATLCTEKEGHQVYLSGLPHPFILEEELL